MDDPNTVQDESKGENPDEFPVRGNPYEKKDVDLKAFDDKVLFDGSIDRAVPEELIVIDLNPRNKKAGVNCQMQMAQMLTMVGGDEERQIGFKPAERQSTSKAWDHSIRFAANAKKEKLESDIFSYLMLLIALFLVMAVVCKQAAYPPKPKIDACGHRIHAALQVQHETPKEWLPLLKNILLIMPILNGLLMSVNTKFNPYKKYVIYNWASQKCVSETYKYRARAKPYNAAPANPEWVLDDEGEDAKPRPLAKRYTDGMKAILDTVANDSTVSESSIMYEKDERTKNEQRMMHLDGLRQSKDVIKHAETSEHYDKLYEMPEKEPFTDDGYSQLSVHEYIACRTIPQHKMIQDKLPKINNMKNRLQVLMYVMSAVSVLLAVENMDLYIAVSTAAISLFSGVMEYQKLETKVAMLNRSLKDLTQVLHDWDSYTFVERRMGHIKDGIVQRTEAAVMKECEMFYDMATGGGGTGGDGGEEEEKGEKKDEKK